MKYRRVLISGNGIVVAFDMCSSSNIIEELTLSDDLKRLTSFVASIKKHLASAQERVLFDPYKFTGDGWILLFPADTNGNALFQFLQELCAFFKTEFRHNILPYLANPPSISGLAFGIEKGPLVPLTIYGQQEYIGRALNIACRLQNSVKDKGGSPAYKALVSNAVFNEYFSSAKTGKVFQVKRTLRNISHGVDYHCRKIELLKSFSAP